MNNIVELPNEAEDTLKGRFLSFLIGIETYGIEISYVTEIVGIQNITEIPEMPAYIKGIINLRGIIIPVMDVRIRFGMEPKKYNDRTCVIIVEFSGSLAGLIVDSVNEVLTLKEEDVVEVPNGKMGMNSRYLQNIGKIGSKVVLLVDCRKLLATDEFEAFKQVI